MSDIKELNELLNSAEGIDGEIYGGNPNAKVWFCGIEYGEGDDNNYKGQYYNVIDKIIAAATGSELEKDAWKKYYLANLYPIQCADTSCWNDDYGFAEKSDYYAYCDMHGRKIIKDNLVKGDGKKVIICFGTSFQWDFIMQFGQGHSADMVKTESFDGLKVVNVSFSEHPNIKNLVIVKHPSAWWSDKQVSAFGKYVSQLIAK
jgi:hypothetical protein